jgi:hypothetical protein
MMNMGKTQTVEGGLSITHVLSWETKSMHLKESTRSKRHYLGLIGTLGEFWRKGRQNQMVGLRRNLLDYARLRGKREGKVFTSRILADWWTEGMERTEIKRPMHTTSGRTRNQSLFIVEKVYDNPCRDVGLASRDEEVPLPFFAPVKSFFSWHKSKGGLG